MISHHYFLTNYVSSSYEVTENSKKTASFWLREKSPCLEFVWSVFSPNVGKYGPEKLLIRTPFTRCLSVLFYSSKYMHQMSEFYASKHILILEGLIVNFWKHHELARELVFQKNAKIPSLSTPEPKEDQTTQPVRRRLTRSAKVFQHLTIKKSLQV